MPTGDPRRCRRAARLAKPASSLGSSVPRFLAPTPTPARLLRLEVAERQRAGTQSWGRGSTSSTCPRRPTPRHLEASSTCSALPQCGRAASRPGEFQPGCQRIPAEAEVSLMWRFGRTRTSWVEWAGRSEGEDVSKEARSDFAEATGHTRQGHKQPRRTRPVSAQHDPPRRAMAVYFNSCL